MATVGSGVAARFTRAEEAAGGLEGCGSSAADRRRKGEASRGRVPGMRAPLVLALLLAAPLALAQDGGRTEERRTPTGSAYEEFLPDWRSGPADVAFGNATLAVPQGARFATDGATWLYVVNASGGLEPPAHGCGDPEGNGTTGAWVLVPPQHCLWARHPGVACWDFEPCRAAGGASHGPYPTTTTPTTRPQPTPTTHLVDSCGRIQGARCTPGPGAAAGLATLVLVAWAARRR